MVDNHHHESSPTSILRPPTMTTSEGDYPLLPHSKPPTSYNVVILVAVANMIWNTLRPDTMVSWPMRLPRLLWEMTIVVVAKMATHESSSVLPPMIHLLLSILLGSTAIVDLFFWAPVFASLTSFETCHGGLFQPRQCQPDYTKGLSRLIVVFQCFVTGLLYLVTSIVAMGRFTTIREEQKIDVMRRLQAERWIHDYT